MMELSNRQLLMVDALREQRRVEVATFAEMFDVTEMTIRRDLISLERLGVAKRFHGGAELGPGRMAEPPFAVRSAMNLEAKRRIAQAAVAEIDDDHAVYIDVGTTGLEVARILAQPDAPARLTVITGNLRALDLLAECDGYTVISVGGHVRPEERSLVGNLAHGVLERVWIDTAVLGVAGVEASAGLTEFNIDDAAIKRLVIERANRVVVAADHSKLGLTSLAHVGRLDSIDLLITDGDGDQAELDKIAATGASYVAV